MQGDHSMLFWKHILDQTQHPHHNPTSQNPQQPPSPGARPPTNRSTSQNLSLPHPLQRAQSAVSQLSIERDSNVASDDDSDAASFKDALQGHEDEVVCPHCAGTSFHARAVKGGGTKLCCSSCGAPV